MPTINIDDAYILDNTGAQVDASVDYAYANSNRNLLDNPFFTVRQRGNGPFTGNVYGVDRWRGGNSRTSVTGNSGYITLSTNSSGNGILRQILSQTYEGTYTFSAVVGGSGSGALFLQDGGGTIIGNAVEFTTTGSTKLVTLTFTTSGTAIGGVAVRVDVGNTISIVCAKLELGPYSTLVNDTQPNYLQELTKCQYYFERIIAETSNLGIGVGIGNGSILYVPIHIQPKRVFPTISYAGTISIGRNAVETNATDIRTSSSYTGASLINGMFQISVDVVNTAQTAYRLILQTGAYIDFSADL